MLVLPIKRKWFDMIRSGEKKEEYREIKDYYDKRFFAYFGGMRSIKGKYMGYNPTLEKPVILRNGYKHDSPKIKCICTLDIGSGKEEWRSKNRRVLLHFENKKN